MVKVGEFVFNWRYGALLVTRLDGNYIHTEIIDKKNVVEADARDLGYAWNPYLRDQEKVFTQESFGHWIHNTLEGAIFENNNHFSRGPIASPTDMIFPFIGNQFHQTILNTHIVANYLEARRSIPEIDAELVKLPNSYDKRKIDFKTLVAELLTIDYAQKLSKLLSACPTEAQLKTKYKNDDEFNVKVNENSVRREFLSSVLANIAKSDFSFESCAAEAKAAGKKEFTNDAAYKEYVLLVEGMTPDLSKELSEERRILEEKFNLVKEEILKIKGSPKITALISEQSMNTCNKTLFDEICKMLDNEMSAEKIKLDRKRAELDHLIKTSGKLNDITYVVWPRL